MEILQIEFLGRTKPLGKPGVIALVRQEQLLRMAQGLARNLPNPERAIQNPHLMTFLLQHNIVRLRPPLPDGVIQIAWRTQKIVFHGTDPKKDIDRYTVKL